MAPPRVADDFGTIRSRLEELRRERAAGEIEVANRSATEAAYDAARRAEEEAKLNPSQMPTHWVGVTVSCRPTGYWLSGRKGCEAWNCGPFRLRETAVSVAPLLVRGQVTPDDINRALAEEQP